MTILLSDYLWSFLPGFILGILIFSSSFTGCSPSIISQQPNSNTLANSETSCNELRINRRPDGNELLTGTRRISENEFLITLKNVSDHRVFMAFTGNEHGDAGFIAYITEVQDENGKFVPDPYEGDYAPGLNVINPAQEIRFRFDDSRKGNHRLKFRYMVDENLVQLINDPRCLFKFSDEASKQISTAYVGTYSPVFKITRNLPATR